MMLYFRLVDVLVCIVLVMAFWYEGDVPRICYPIDPDNDREPRVVPKSEVLDSCFSLFTDHVRLDPFSVCITENLPTGHNEVFPLFRSGSLE